MEQEKVILEEVAGSAQRIMIRVDLGSFTVSGPRENILRVESLVAFSTIVNELYREGYQMVSPAQYAEEYGLSDDTVYAKVKDEGSLFAVVYPDSQPPSVAVPLEERAAVELGPHLR